MKRILYHSTNKNSQLVEFKDALINGLAPDGGLYMPNRIPIISESDQASYRNLEYADIATDVLWRFLEGCIERDVLNDYCIKTYNYTIPFEDVGGLRYILRLDQGPTASFKDFAAGLMARLMNHFLEQDNRTLTILTATSGDTGGAVASAFAGMDRIKVIVLFPEKEVSDLQRRQITTIGGNIQSIAVRGKFDDCQRLVKMSFKDEDLVRLNLSSANSINIGRLLPQIVYYFYAASRINDRNNKFIVSVPSGNFGNLMGGIFAMKMGLVVSKFVVSVNANDEFPKFLESEEYKRIDPSIDCISSAMNVGHPSNLARLIEIYGGQLSETGELISKPDMDAIKRDISSLSISDSLTKATISELWKERSILLDPHGAVAWGGLEEFLKHQSYTDSASVVFETAHPAKFSNIMFDCIGNYPEPPESFKKLEGIKESFCTIDPDFKSLKGTLLL